MASQGKSKAGEASQTKEEQPSALFFKKPVPLDAKRHGNAGCVPSKDFSFARDTNSIPLNVVEFVEAAKNYPLVFAEDDLTLPVAIVGLEKNNYFVDTNGSWKQDAYVPAYVRKYPFIFMHVPESKQFVMCVDEEASHFRMQAGEAALPFYNGTDPTDMARAALEFCTAFHNHHQMTRQFCKALKEAGLFTPNTSNAKLYNGRNIRLGGFMIIDEKKLAALPDETVLEFHKKGFLPYIHFALMSTSNWKRLVDMAAAAEKSAAH